MTKRPNGFNEEALALASPVSLREHHYVWISEHERIPVFGCPVCMEKNRDLTDLPMTAATQLRRLQGWRNRATELAVRLERQLDELSELCEEVEDAALSLEKFIKQQAHELGKGT